MMRVLVVEDEPPARERLAAAIRNAAPEARIVAGLSSVAETIDWLSANPAPDLLFLDIQLSDGNSFEILRRTAVACPVIFATAFDEYLLEAFRSNGIDYLLKPVREENVAAAIDKYRRLRQHFRGDHAALLDALERKGRRERLLVRKGSDLISIKLAGVAYFFTTEKLVFAVLSGGARHMLDRPLAELEKDVDPARFFRANRAWLVSIDAVVRCRPYGKGKLLLELRPPPPEDVIVSQERAAAFREWFGA
jgi:two-component system LytT family response regulator